MEIRTKAQVDKSTLDAIGRAEKQIQELEGKPKKIDPNDPSTWPNDYRQCGFCKFGSRNHDEVKAHLEKVHGKTVK